MYITLPTRKWNTNKLQLQFWQFDNYLRAPSPDKKTKHSPIHNPANKVRLSNHINRLLRNVYKTRRINCPCTHRVRTTGFRNCFSSDALPRTRGRNAPSNPGFVNSPPRTTCINRWCIMRGLAATCRTLGNWKLLWAVGKTANAGNVLGNAWKIIGFDKKYVFIRFVT